jgi:hypothetical protein
MRLLQISTPEILKDPGASPRHRLEAGKELRIVAANGPEATPTTGSYVITFNLGDRVEKYEWNNGTRVDSSTPKPNADTAPQELLPVIATNKTKDGRSGEPI